MSSPPGSFVVPMKPQAAKAAHLRVLAMIERNKGNWDLAEDYLQKYYSALKERVA